MKLRAYGAKLPLDEFKIIGFAEGQMASGRVRPASLWRSALLCLGLTALASGCARLPVWFPGHTPAKAARPPAAVAKARPASQPRHRKPMHRPERPSAAPPAQVAMIDPKALVGKKPPVVSGLLGAPSSIAKDEMSLVWTYRAEGCALKIYFYPDLKTSDFHVLKFSLADADGKPLDADAACRQKLLALRTHDTG